MSPNCALVGMKIWCGGQELGIAPDVSGQAKEKHQKIAVPIPNHPPLLKISYENETKCSNKRRNAANRGISSLLAVVPPVRASRLIPPPAVMPPSCWNNMTLAKEPPAEAPSLCTVAFVILNKDMSLWSWKRSRKGDFSVKTLRILSVKLPFVVPSYSWWEGPFYGVGLKVYQVPVRQIWLRIITTHFQGGNPQTRSQCQPGRTHGRRDLLRWPV